MILDQCKAASVSFFYKQGNAHLSDRDKVLDGETYDEYPDQRPEAACRPIQEAPLAQGALF